MLTLNTKIDTHPSIEIAAQLILPFELREKSRLRVTMSNGEEVGVYTVRGTVMRHSSLGWSCLWQDRSRACRYLGVTRFWEI